MNSQRITLSLLAAAALVGPAASTAAADSIAYVKGGDVYLSTTDGARQFQVTSGGGYDHVAQADDGTLLATTTADSHLRRLDRLGNVLSDIATPVSDHSGGVIRFQGPFDADISPNGRTVAYGYIESGLFVDPTTGHLSSQTRNGVGFTSSTAENSFTDDGYKHSNDWDGPEFVDDTNILVSNGPSDPYDDPIATEVVGSGNPVNWFSDPGMLHPMEATINRNKSIIAAVAGPDAGTMNVYHDMDGRFGGTQGQPVNVESCFTYSGSRIGSPTFNADGTRGWWSTADGLVTAPFAMTPGAGGCGNAVNAAPVVAGASSPDWGPAGVPASRPAAPAPAPAPAPLPLPVPAPKPGRGTHPGSDTSSTSGTSTALTFTIKKVALRKALKSGLVLTVPGSGKATATATSGRRTVGTGSTRSTTLTLRFTAKAKKALARKKRVVVKVAVTRGAQHGTTSTTLAR